jgi:hypothetical protein
MNKSRAGIDWVAAMLEYAASDASLRDIAAKLGCNRHAVERRSALDGWSAARDKFRTQVGHRAQALQSESRAQKLKDWNDADFKGAKAARGLLLKNLNRLIEVSNEENIENAVEIRNVLAGLETVQRIGRLALGATTDNQGMIGDPGEDGIAAPRLADFYASVKFEGPTEPQKTDKDDEPTHH